MLISYSHQFLFIHNDKTAGSSVREALQPFAETDSGNPLRKRMVWLGPLNRLAGLHQRIDFPAHVQASAVKRCLPPAVYRNLFKFMFVRNPWDRLVSRYAYLLQTPHHRHYRRVLALGSFEGYVYWEIHRGKMLQSPLCCDASGRLIVDFLGKFETLRADYAEICRRIGISAPMRHTNRSSHRDFREYYSRGLRDVVARHFRVDLELFGYDFDNSAIAA